MCLKREKTPEPELHKSLQEARNLQLSALKNMMITILVDKEHYSCLEYHEAQFGHTVYFGMFSFKNILVCSILGQKTAKTDHSSSLKTF